MPNLSVLIPARNEEWLARTVLDILCNATLSVEVLVVLDGAPATPPIPSNPRVTVVELGKSIGQRAATNLAARIATGDYILKCDGHSAFSHGFDSVLTAAAADGETIATPILRVLDPWHWACGICKATWLKPSTKASEIPTECPECHHDEQQWTNAVDGRCETMTPWGGCWCMTRDRYWEIDGLDETFGSFGHMNTELGCKAWLSGGRVLTIRGAWCAHLFRSITQRPYPGYSIARLQNSNTTWLRNLWPGQTRPLSWMIEKFRPPWWYEVKNAAVLQQVVEEGERFSPRPSAVQPRRPTEGIVYYTDNTLDSTILAACQKQLDRCRGRMPLVCVSQKPMRFGDRNIVLSGQIRSYLSIWRQIVAGLEAIDTDIVFLAEHDVLYSPEHFEFRPSAARAYWYNTSRWCVSAVTGELRNYRGMKALSHLCAARELLLEHFRARVARSEREGDRWVYTATCEPGAKQPPEGIDDVAAMIWSTEIPNLDIKAHGTNWGQRSAIRWGPEEAAPGWGRTRGRFPDFLTGLDSLPLTI